MTASGSLAMSIDAILFDLDGTLIDSAQVIASVINNMRAEQHLAPVDVARFRQWVSLGADELLRRGMDRPGEDASDLVRDFRDRYRAMSTPLDSLYPGVGETVATLARLGVPMAICSKALRAFGRGWVKAAIRRVRRPPRSHITAKQIIRAIAAEVSNCLMPDVMRQCANSATASIARKPIPRASQASDTTRTVSARERPCLR